MMQHIKVKPKTFSLVLLTYDKISLLNDKKEVKIFCSKDYDLVHIEPFGYRVIHH